ncbi:hypothetical protein [Streptomyces sp. ALI-76-A]|jgi:hypothetical protein|uniref:hypothetical protein n=1 Tax=Streptomyces sp. ALI-76-A TaxID=3025736 RepID=UPI00256F44EB|nr:hypothetical protein [Streptomyces sp. ALI-76-A]MDL5203066.1 hypothetical protein [Streptomyces sp. ALI-76-A]
MRVIAVCVTASAALAVVGGAVPVAGAEGVPEADLAYHGSAAMAGGRVEVRFTPRNHGPSAVPDATVRLRWSEPLADQQALPEGCARAGERVVVCRTGALAADEVGERIGLRVLLRQEPSEVLLELDTVWGGGAVDGNRANDQQRVLVLDTGDTYHF